MRLHDHLRSPFGEYVLLLGASLALIDQLRGRRAALRRMADEDLMALVVRRDADAFAVVFDRHSGPAYSLAYRMCADRELAEDVVQETFMSLWRGVGSFQAGRGSLRSWLLAATRNRMIDAFRTRTAKQSADVPDAGIAETLVSPADTHAEVSALTEAVALRSAMTKLPEEQRTVIEMAFFAGLSHSEIAEKLGLPAGTVKGRMRLGLTKLRLTLGTPASSVI